MIILIIAVVVITWIPVGVLASRIMDTFGASFRNDQYQLERSAAFGYFAMVLALMMGVFVLIYSRSIIRRIANR